MEQAKLDELKAEHGEVYVLTDDDDEIEIVVRMPTRAEFERFGAMAEDAKKGVRAMAQFVTDCLVHPSRDELKALFDRLPGLPLSFGKELTRLAGAGRTVQAKKA